MYYFFPEKMAFLHSMIHDIPPQAVALTVEQYQTAQDIPAGHRLAADENGYPVFVLEPTAAPELGLAQAAMVARVNDIFQSRMAAIADGYPLHERESWPVQLEEAKALQANPEAATPWLDACAAARGLDKTELATRVLAKDAAYRLISGTLSGIRQRHEDAIAKLETVEQAQAYDVQAWWPSEEGEPQQ